MQRGCSVVIVVVLAVVVVVVVVVIVLVEAYTHTHLRAGNECRPEASVAGQVANSGPCANITLR